MKIELFKYLVIRPLGALGYTHTFFDLHLDTLVYTWTAMALMCGITFFARKRLEYSKYSLVGVALERALTFVSGLCVESFGYFRYRYFAFVASVFTFTLACNFVGLLPFFDESTKDLNTTLALAVCCFVYVQYQHIQAAGFVEYLKDYARPIIFMLPLEIIGKVATIISMSFRLFGNILGGSIVFMIMVQAVGVYKVPFMIASYALLALYAIFVWFFGVGHNVVVRYVFFSLFIGVFFLAGAQLFFGVFEGMIQAFVLTMLTLTYLSVALSEVEVHETKNVTK